MFVEAIKTNAPFTKQFRTIQRRFGSQTVEKSAATMMVVNQDGWLLTCKHVATTILLAHKINQQYQNYKQQLARGVSADALNKTFKYAPNTTVQLKHQFFDVFKGTPKNMKIHLHKTLDLALIHVQGDVVMQTTQYPTFSRQDVASGMMLCRLGYPFVEYTSVRYDEGQDDIFFTNEGILNTPYFPLEGMVTRKVAQGQHVSGFEMSTPGLKGQSGGPIFDAEGLVWGIQSMTRHLDLEFKTTKETETGTHDAYAFLHVGMAVSSVEIIRFLEEHQVSFQAK